MNQQQEQALLTAFRKMSEKDRQWILALSDGCVNAPTKAADDVLWMVRYSGAEQRAKQ